MEVHCYETFREHRTFFPGNRNSYSYRVTATAFYLLFITRLFTLRRTATCSHEFPGRHTNFILLTISGICYDIDLRDKEMKNALENAFIIRFAHAAYNMMIV